jgi:hypothetical protein
VNCLETDVTAMAIETLWLIFVRLHVRLVVITPLVVAVIVGVSVPDVPDPTTERAITDATSWVSTRFTDIPIVAAIVVVVVATTGYAARVHALFTRL